MRRELLQTVHKTTLTGSLLLLEVIERVCIIHRRRLGSRPRERTTKRSPWRKARPRFHSVDHLLRRPLPAPLFPLGIRRRRLQHGRGVARSPTNHVVHLVDE